MGWDVYGNTQRLRMVGGTMDPVVRPDQAREDSSASRENDRNNRSMTDLVEEIRPNSPLQPVVPPRPRSSHAVASPPPRPPPSPLMPPSQEEPSSVRGAGGAESRPDGSNECKIC